MEAGRILMNPEEVQRMIDKFEGEYRWLSNFWGNCTCPRCRDIDGQNWLGRILMVVREELRT